MVRFSAQWFPSGKVHKKTQVQLGFFRGEITCGQVTRFTLSRFDDRDEAELWALSVVLRFRGVFPDPTPNPSPDPSPFLRNGEGRRGR